MKDWTGQCHRCGTTPFSFTQSMLNEELICGECKDTERRSPEYRQAEVRDAVSYAARMVEAGCTPEQVANVREFARQLMEGEL